ncbi:hypothetical protein [Bacteroides sp.]|uniref:hypothetical protein n=1 Tax=Bacteroides sp. TaxID=29523 RepID=UPI00261A3C65|nr:hypothetical protein [Bacteroides sp.]MDD3040392.1 hypothetical protein [Bacteroides sp.]
MDLLNQESTESTSFAEQVTKDNQDNAIESEGIVEGNTEEKELSWVDQVQNLVTEMRTVEDKKLTIKEDLSNAELDVEALKNMLADAQAKYENLIQAQNEEDQHFMELKSQLKALVEV